MDHTKPHYTVCGQWRPVAQPRHGVPTAGALYGKRAATAPSIASGQRCAVSPSDQRARYRGGRGKPKRSPAPLAAPLLPSGADARRGRPQRGGGGGMKKSFAESRGSSRWPPARCRRSREKTPSCWGAPPLCRQCSGTQGRPAGPRALRSSQTKRDVGQRSAPRAPRRAGSAQHRHVCAETRDLLQRGPSSACSRVVSHSITGGIGHRGRLVPAPARGVRSSRSRGLGRGNGTDAAPWHLTRQKSAGPHAQPERAGTRVPETPRKSGIGHTPAREQRAQPGGARASTVGIVR